MVKKGNGFRTPSSNRSKISGTTANTNSMSGLARKFARFAAEYGVRTAGSHAMNKITKAAKQAMVGKAAKVGYNERSTSDRIAYVRNRKNKRVSIKRAPRVTVSKRFKAQVNKALEPQMNFGQYTETVTGGHNFPVPFGNRQITNQLAPSIGAGGGFSIFSPLDILDNASVLFNNQPGSQTKAAATLQVTDFNTLALDPRRATINVKQQTYSVVIRNNSNRTWIIQLYEVSPKKAMNHCTDSSALQQWTNCLLNESVQQDSTTKRINMEGTTPNTMYASPYDSKLFMKDWNVEKHDIILDPGQVYDHVMNGPVGEYDFSKFWRQDGSGAADEFLNVQPRFTRELFYTARLDLVADASGNIGRWGYEAANKGLAYEFKKYTKLTCPATAGGVLTETGTTTAFKMTQQRDCFYKKHWFEGAYTPTERIDVQTSSDNI